MAGFVLKKVEELFSEQHVGGTNDDAKSGQVKQLTDDCLAPNFGVQVLPYNQLVLEETVAEVMNEFAVLNAFIQRV